MPDSDYGSIYLYILDTGEKYVGQTKQLLSQRHYGHLRRSDNLIDLKLKKHSYTLRLLHVCPLEEMNCWEIYFIAQYDTYYNGLNLTTGGDSNYQRDEYTLKKISAKISKPVLQYSLQGDFIAEYPSCVKASEITGIKSSISSCAHKKIPYAGGFIWRFKTDNYPLHIDTSHIAEYQRLVHEHRSESCKNRKCSEETRRKMSESHKGKIRTEEHRKNLSKALKGRYKGQPVEPKIRRNHSEGAKAYWDTVPEKQRKERFEKAKQTRLKNGGYNTIKPKRAILQYTLNDEFVKEWESATDVQKSLGIKSTNIVACCKGKYKQSGGFIWRYKC